MAQPRESKITSNITIGLAGHTNVGKTTLIRTFTKTTFGEVHDRRNVTKYAEIKRYDALQATFVDCPGFQNANLLLTYWKVKEIDPEAASKVLATFPKEQIIYDERAMEAITSCDIVLYVATLEYLRLKI